MSLGTRPLAAIVLALGALTGLAACDAPNAVNDAGPSPGQDSGTPTSDSGTPLADGGDPVHDAGPAPTLDEEASTVVADPSEGLVADGMESATITVTLKDTAGVPVVGAAVELVVTSGEGAVVVQPDPTNSGGVAIGSVASLLPGTLEVVATIEPGQWDITLDDDVSISFDECVSAERMMQDAVLGPALSICLGCHNAYGRAPELGAMHLAMPGDPDYVSDNLSMLRTLAGLPVEVAPGETLPYLVAKPLGYLDHGGGVIIREGDVATELLLAFSEHLENEPTCPEPEVVDFFDGVELLDATETLRKATFTLTGELPSRVELEDFAGTEDALDVELDALLATDAFERRLKEMYNDELLTEESNVGARALNRLVNVEFPRRFYFRPCDDGFNQNTCCTAGSCCQDDPSNDARFCELGSQHGTEAVARGPAELVAHVVREGLSFQDVLAADYVMVNPYSAAIYGIEDVTFDSDVENDRTEFKPAQIKPSGSNGVSVPHSHAGVLSTSPWLRKYPTTVTNVNRHRARMLYEKFLDVDVMTFLNFAIDQNEELGEDPFRDARTCSACHAALDPVAGNFQNWKQSSRFLVNGWEDWMRLPGFAGEEMPAGDVGQALPWLAERVVEDPRFALSTAKAWFALLVGTEPLTLPTNPDVEGYEAQLIAFHEQTAYFDELREFFDESGYDLKALIKEIVFGPYFRAENAPVADDERAAVWQAMSLGVGKVLTPEQLHNKLVSTTGYFWTTNLKATGTNQLLNANRFRLLLGGIDSDVITSRFRDPFPILGNITRRMANEMACVAVPQDLSIRDTASRKLLRNVEKTTVPEDESGQAIADAQEAIRADLKELHLMFFGEHVDDGHPELEATWQLWLDVWRAGKARVDASEQGSNQLFRCQALVDFHDPQVAYDEELAVPTTDHVKVVSDPDYTVRTWRAVVAYLMSDYRFLFE
jgi:hypothetical protein